MIAGPATILPGEQLLINTGIKINLDSMKKVDFMRYAAIAMPRSGRGSKEGLVLANTIGLIDQDYIGEIMLCCWARPTNGSVHSSENRLGGNPIHIEPFDRIAQLVFVPVLRPEIRVTNCLSQDTARGAGGFGSTGK